MPYPIIATHQLSNNLKRGALEGEKGALLRREGLYSSHIVEWRRVRVLNDARCEDDGVVGGDDVAVA